MADLPPMILGLDVSKSRTGACWGRVGETPRFASIVGNEINIDAASFRLLRWVSETARIEKFDAAYIEAQIRGWGDDVQKLRQQIPSMLTINDMIRSARNALYGRSVPIHQVPSNTARKHFIGHGGLQKEHAKSAALLMCRELGWNANGNDEGDAAAVWFYGCLKQKPHACHIITPMMQQRVISLSSSKTASVGGLA